MPISLTMFLATLSSIFRSRAALQLENLALRHQIGVLQRSTRRRPRLTPVDRLVWVWLSRGGAAGARRWPLVSIDFFTVPTLRFQILYVFFGLGP